MASNEIPSELGAVVCGPFSLNAPRGSWLPQLGFCTSGFLLLFGWGFLASDLQNLRDTGRILFVLGVIFAATVTADIFYRRSRRQTLLFGEKAILLRRGRESQTHQYDRIQCVRVRQENARFNGAFIAVRFHLELWETTNFHRPPVIRASGFISPKGSSLENYRNGFDGALNRIAAVFAERIRRGERLNGEGFFLDGPTLRIGRQAILVDTLAKAAIYEGKACLWRTGETIPAFQIDPCKLNALPLLLVLQEIISKRKDMVVTGECSGLGRVLFEDKMSGKAVMAWTLFGMFITMGGLALSMFLVWHLNSWMICLPFIPVLLFGSGVLYHAFEGRRKVFRCHEHGICHIGVRRQRELLYADLADFDFKMFRCYHKGIYTGTALHLTFTPTPETQLKPIKFMTSRMKMEEAELNALNQHIRTIVTRQAVQRIKAGQKLKWGKLFLTKDGVIFQPKILFWRGKEKLIPYACISTGAQNDSRFFFEENMKRRVLPISPWDAGYSTGLHAFVFLRAETQNAPAAAPQVKGGAGQASNFR